MDIKSKFGELVIQYFEGVEVKKVHFHDDKKLISFFMKTRNPLPEASKKSFSGAIQAVLPFVRGVKVHDIVVDGREDPIVYLDAAIECALFDNVSLRGSLLRAQRRLHQQEIVMEIKSPLEHERLTSLGLSRQISEELYGLTKERLEVNFHLVEESQEAFAEEIEEKTKAIIVQQMKEAPAPSKEPKRREPAKGKGEGALYRNTIKGELTPLNTINEEEMRVISRVEVFEKDYRVLNSGKVLVILSISDYTNSMGAKLFLKKKEFEDLYDQIELGKMYLIEGRTRYDSFERELVVFINNINDTHQEVAKEDQAEEKRVEFHLHTNMSDMDGIASAKTIVKRALAWGHPAVAITDHGGLQAFPEAMEAARGKDIKVLYGVEGYLFDDQELIIDQANEEDFNQAFVVFDIETTGFSAVHDKIIEIGAVKIENRQIVDQYSALIDPQQALPDKIIELTGITDDMLRGKPTIEEVFPEFLNFVGDCPVVAHNADFDTGFIKYRAKAWDYKFDNIIVDTLALSRLLLTKLKRHRLNLVAKHLDINLDQHHRAVDDASATALIFIKLLEMLEEKEVFTLAGVNSLVDKDFNLKNKQFNHVIIFAKNYVGLKNLYKLVSHAHMESFYRKPRISKSKIMELREGLVIGSACEAGEIYRAILDGKDDDELTKLARFYDYLEIQPLGNNQFLIDKGSVTSRKDLEDINKRIISLGEGLNKPVIATCDVHFLDPEDEVYRRIIMSGQGFGDAEDQAPLYYRTTDEMLAEFSYLGEDKAYEVVVTNTRALAESFEHILPIPDGTYPPRIEGSDKDLREMCFKKAHSIYGDPLPQIVEARLTRELDSIINNGYAVMYIIAQKLVTKSLEDGYLVGSRGSVGSSFAATMSDITEVNPLPPHYVCPTCKESIFIEDGSIGSGADLPDRTCSNCQEDMIKDGHDIPFEVFLGFDGDKEPDIDLNFAGVYQATSHKYTEVLFGKGYVFKAGTIGTIADKTAYGFVKNYFEDKGEVVNSREINRLLKGLTGIKRTTGQHPGGIMVVPDYKEVFDFCPIQHPANDANSGVVTTHFDYHSLSGRLLKLDILGHDVPTIIKQLENMTGVDVQKIPLDDQDTVKIFTSTDSLGIQDQDYSEDLGSLGIPEFGTKFVRQMLKDTMPSTFAELVRISGLSHGTDVWINNAQDLVRNGIAELKDVISTRDDIMNYLIYAGLPPVDAFTIMERVRKGKGLTEDNIALMKENKVPQWYIDSCNTIKYMFPKAHAVAYVMMSFRIAYFKVHHPLAFYAAYFTSKVDSFDAELICHGHDMVKRKMKELENPDYEMSNKENDLYTILEVANEMYARGLDFHTVDLYRSHYDEFEIVDGKLLPPLRGLQGVGENVAVGIYQAAREGEFISKEDLKQRAKASKTVIEALDQHGCLKGLPEKNQLQLFDFGML